MATLLTWCEECGEDMHVNGGAECPDCGMELCYNCLRDHKNEGCDFDDDEIPNEVA